MDGILGPFLVKLAASLAAAAIQGAARALRGQFSDPPRVQALERCFEAALAAMGERLERDLEADPEHLRSVLEFHLAKKEVQKELGRELAELLDRKDLAVDDVVAVFAEVGLVPASFPGLDLPAAARAFEDEYGAARKREPLLQPEVLIGIAEKQESSLKEIANHTGDMSLRLGMMTPPPGASPETLRRAYLLRLVESAGALQLSGVDPGLAGNEHQAERLRLDAVYTGLRTSRFKSFERGSKLRPEEGELREAESRETLTAVEALDTFPRLVLLGDPGGGKSAFSAFVALCLAGEALESKELNLAALTAPLPHEDEEDKEQSGAAPEPQTWRHGALLPVSVILRDFAARGLAPEVEAGCAKHLLDFLSQELERAGLGAFKGQLEADLHHGRALVLLDGLDEVPEPQGQRQRLLETIRDFERTFRQSRILVTSRPYAYARPEWRLDGFEEASLAPFDKPQIVRFIARWYEHVGPRKAWSADEVEVRAGVLRQRILGNPRLAELAERPLLLTLMASLAVWRGGSLPEKRQQLYEAAVQLLLDLWEKQRVKPQADKTFVVVQPSLVEFLKVDAARVRRFLNTLAFEAHAAQPQAEGTADVPGEKIAAGLLGISSDPEVKQARLLEYLRDRAGLLLHRGADVYTFPHRSFQEYLAACHLTDTDFPQGTARRARQEPERWKEVALLAAAKAATGAAGNLWQLVDELCHRPKEGSATGTEWARGSLIAGQAVVEIADLETLSPAQQDKLVHLRGLLAELVTGAFLPARERVEAGRLLGRLGDPRDELRTIADMELCWVPKGPFFMGAAPGDEEAFDDEKPGGVYEIPYGYWIGRHPVTQAQFGAFVAAGGYGVERYWVEAQADGVWAGGQVQGERSGPVQFGEPFDLPNHPVVGITWYEMLAYCRWLTEKARAAGWIEAGWRFALPSEPEWEKSARGGLEMPPRPTEFHRLGSGVGSGAGVEERHRKPERVHPFEAVLGSELANYDETGVGSTSTPGCFSAGESPYGCQDLVGNVWEWTRSHWVDNYPYPADEEGIGKREALAAGIQRPRVLRGGSFAFNRRFVRCSARLRGDPGVRYWYLGCRVVLLPYFSEL